MVKLVENASFTTEGVKARIRLISEGLGSSGIYPGDVLRRDGAMAWPSGTQLFMDHLTTSDEWERDGNHSIRDLVGVTLTDAQFVEGEKALYSEAKFFANAATFISEAMDYIGLSVEACGEIVNGIIESINPSPLNAIAVVPRAGRDGKITELIESYRESGKIINEDLKHIEKEDKPMDEKDIKALAEALAAALAPSFTAISEALVPKVVEVKPDEVDIVAVVEAAHEAGLPKSARNRIAEAAKTGGDYKVLIEAEKADLEEIRKAVITESASEGKVTLSGSSTTTYDVGAWS